MELLTLAVINTDALTDAGRGIALPVILFVLTVGSIIFAMQGRAAGLVGFLIVGVIIVMLVTTPEVLERTGQWMGRTLLGGGAASADAVVFVATVAGIA